MIRLKNHYQSPPGQFFIKVSIQGGAAKPVFGHCEAPNCYQFGPSPDIKSVATTLKDFAAANGLSNGGFANALQMVDQYTCHRLGGGKRWCKDSDKDYASTTASLSTSGGCCGAKL